MEEENSESDESKTGADETKSTNGQPLTPLKVEYCRFCSMPYDFCDFGDKWETGVCFKECSTRYPEIFPLELMTLDGLGFSTLSLKSKKKTPKQVPQEIFIQKSARTKRKVITSITGLHLFGVKLEQAAKLFSKHFATGANVIKGTPGQSDRIDIQGDVEDPIVELLLSNYPSITEEKITKLQPKMK
ncbi:uncharacterized protein TA13120 [Theileria annulata]|uniref:SUI1 domain-containing protein n=1 Tax=Theileria annulata TaxID=5874 RepID=Q4UED2_THEAN|nr:uncharacterized protein TA13120 [Theileria annulata]CAI74557.1 hypothetical protein, conserved [Theileria annulata]|eukprot:XP_952289.1 hypothetical protein, conserved [Theileria annulata]